MQKNKNTGMMLAVVPMSEVTIVDVKNVFIPEKYVTLQDPTQVKALPVELKGLDRYKPYVQVITI
jgi:hypothetical protein